MQVGYFISWWHPILVHFPIALLLSAFVAEAYGWLRKRPAVSSAAKALLAAGCVISLFTFVTGNFSEVFAVRGGTHHAPVDDHAFWAMWTTWFFIILTVTRFYLASPSEGGKMILRNSPLKGDGDTPPLPGGKKAQSIHWTGSRAWPFMLYFLGLTVASGLLIYTGHLGGMLVYHHGANVLASHSTHALDMQDLRDLYQEQTRESIIYSEMMHHIFGWLVLTLSVTLIISRIWPGETKVLWKFGPFVLLAGGFFLMIFSDTDSWPLSHARPIYDKEVLQHKIFAALMLAAGIGGLIKRRRGTSMMEISASGFSNPQYSLALALLALVGGGLLFTHVHSVAPFSNRAIGVYLHHLTMGIIALCAGGVSFWEACRPSGSRWRGFLWPGILLMESALLITYNENIPWFIKPFLDQPVAMNHDPRYQLEVVPIPVNPLAGRACHLRFLPRDTRTGGVLENLQIVHENPLHLIIVSKDLSFFDHIHPKLQKDGSLTLDYVFPRGGDFLLFADIVPQGAANQSFRIPIKVGGASPPPQKLVETAYDTVSVGKEKARVLLFTQPVIPAPGQPVHLKFALSDENERGIADLEPYLGCPGHCVIISEDTHFYLHTHPEGHRHGQTQTSTFSLDPIPNAEEGLPKLGPDRQMMFAMGMTSPSMKYSGPEIIFPAAFPKSGLYKVWGQFKHNGEILSAPFVIRIP